MKLIVCLDQNNGLLFNRRRQSRDRTVAQDIMSRLGSGRLWMHPYSASLFSQWEAQVSVAEDFLAQAGPEDFCFLENAPQPTEAYDVIVYRWDRVYPADTTFDLSGLHLIGKEEFPGFSHDRITREVYVP